MIALVGRVVAAAAWLYRPENRNPVFGGPIIVKAVTNLFLGHVVKMILALTSRRIKISYDFRITDIRQFMPSVTVNRKNSLPLLRNLPYYRLIINLGITIPPR